MSKHLSHRVNGPQYDFLKGMQEVSAAATDAAIMLQHSVLLQDPTLCRPQQNIRGHVYDHSLPRANEDALAVLMQRYPTEEQLVRFMNSKECRDALLSVKGDPMQPALLLLLQVEGTQKSNTRTTGPGGLVQNRRET